LSDFSRRPFFSIGITTCNRPEMLRECIESVLGQSFGDFEVIVGNDFTQQKLSARKMGVEDERIRIMNYPENIGEMRNMNTLLAASNGRYFTWLADDDMYTPAFLEAAYSALVQFDYPACLFTSFIQGSTFPKEVRIDQAKTELLRGAEFLEQYLSRKLKTMGCGGLFELDYVREIGGVEQLGTGFSPGSDNLLAIRAGLLDNVAYINAPLYFLRAHDKSISWVSRDVKAYKTAQDDLLAKSVQIFNNERLREDFNRNLFLLLKWCMRDYFSVVKRTGRIKLGTVMDYMVMIYRHSRKLRNHRCRIMAHAVRSLYALAGHFVTSKAKSRSLVAVEED